LETAQVRLVKIRFPVMFSAFNQIKSIIHDHVDVGFKK
jgi:hypothetical protein